MTSSADTYENQRELYENIKKVGINIKKDGWDRKNSDYFKRRLQMLENLWSEFQFNHDRLSKEVGVSHIYFTSNLYDTALQCYKEVKELIRVQHQQVSTYKRSVGPSVQPTSLGDTSQQEKAGTSSNTEQKQEPHESEEEEKTMNTDENSGDNNMDQSPPRLQQNPNKRDTGSNSKLDDLLRKQSANFKAFMRAAAIIQVEFISEKWEFQDALQTLQARWTAIDSLHWEIECELNGDKNPIYEERYTRFENQYLDLKKALNTKMWSGAYREKTTPKLEIPVFHGKFNQWIPFKDLFTEAIHNNSSLSNAQKMQFLKSKVQGEAERLIQHLQISSDNYLVCWDILNNRYNNKKLIFTSHINMLFNLPTMQQQSLAPIKKIHDVTIECLHAIKNLEVDVKTWDPLLVHILAQKLDAETYSDYIESLKNSRELPVLKDFLDYLEAKFTSMESSQRKQDSYQKSSSGTNQHQEAGHIKKHNNYNKNQAASNNKVTKSCHASTIICPLCNDEHGLYFCAKFLEMSNDERLNTINKLQVCINCLYSHKGKKCTSSNRCRKCKAKHNTLMHEAAAKNNEQTSSSSHVSQNDEALEILLATAIVKVEAADGTQYNMRALVDQGSQISLITEHAAQLLGNKRQKCKGVVFGVGEKESNCKGMITISCSSAFSDFTFRKTVYIMKNLIKNLPNKTFTKPSWPQIQNISLADPEFNISRPVDLLFGADIYSQIMLGGMIKSDDVNQPIAQQTHLGWLLCGNVNTFHCNIVINNLEDMKQFWDSEDIKDQANFSEEDQKCMEYYSKTTQRLENGRYEVRLPMKQDWECKLGSSKQIAIAQFKTLERKLGKQQELAKAYKEFIAEYIDLGHMQQSTCNKTLDCYLPHHGVERAESTTTKYRVVFNASAKTSTGWSLNDLMYKGPNLQQDLQTTLIQWRQYKYAYTADIEKMYRQILVAHCDQNLQQIVWRETPEQPLLSYQLATVTYGTKAAPFLAIMTLRRLAEDERQHYPEASKVVEESFYVDDLVHGSHTIEQAQELISDLKLLLKSGGFNLRKWSSNEPALLENATIQHNEESTVFNFKTDQTSKTLGLCWNPNEDKFTFQCSISSVNKKHTKRSLLAEISKLFDPLGWLAPVSTKLKLLFQKLWEGKLQWDDVVSDNIHKEWCKVQADIMAINLCEVPRWLRCNGKQAIELHGFSDASLDAYACVIYARVHPSSIVTLVAAKSKIVPHRKVTTLPRLELNGAHLLSKLMQKVKASLHQHDIRVYGWTDSMVVLGWIQGDPSRWKTYVENRVQKINSVIPRSCWDYVKSNENPADAASRGQYAGQLKENKLWWQGPMWLSSFEMRDQVKKVYTSDQDVKTAATKQVNAAQINTETTNIIEQLLRKHSSINHVIRIVAWLQRALNLKLGTLDSKHRQLPSYLTLQELNSATKAIVKQTQQNVFETDMSHLRKHGRLASNSKLLPLNPYIDQEGLLRVGGRLTNATLTEEMKHPMIIPYDSHLTHLLIDQAHQMTFHGGPRLTLSHLRQKYWIIGGVRATKMQVRKCVTCRKISPKKQQQIMGELPSARINPAPPFYHTGVDYTGFVEVKMNKGRGAKTTKGYIAIFICMVTKAVHIELVSDLTSSAFLAALNRMATRRGAPRHLYSDNGTNFVGANRLLMEQYGEIENSYRNEELQKKVAEMTIQWHFNAPAWPTAGGLWERAVRSLKHHLKRVVGEQRLTFEEFTTILTKLEACLNSRPLCALSENVEDLDCLTPAHFLTGRSGLTVIETREDARTRWELTRKMYSEIWKKWKNDYLCQLLARTKWQKPQNNLKVGDLVVVNDDQRPAGKWLMGRVIELHPGDDGYVRVVTLKTRNGVMKRPITKLSILPIDSEENSKPQNIKIEHKKQISNEETTERQQTATTSKINFIGLVMTLLYLLSPATATTNTTNFIELQQGLYFDKSTNMRLIRDEWKLVVYYDVKPYWHGTAVFTKFIDHLENTCSQLNQKTQCDIIALQLRHAFAELEHYNRLLLNPQGRVNMRSKRGLINGVGSIARSLFGVLDDQFAEQYQRDIELIQENEKHLALLSKNQTTIIEAEYNILRRSEETIEKQYKLFNQHLLRLDKLTSNLQREIEAQELSIEFVMSAISANNFIEHLRNVQEILLDTVTNIYNGKMNLHLIALEQLRDELNVISGQLSKDVALPITNIQEDFFRLYHLLQVKAKTSERYLIIEIRVPLISRENYEVYHMIPVPKKDGGNMVTLLPIAELLAVNIQKDSYLPMTVNDLHQCMDHDSTTLLCPMKTPVYHMKSDESLCKRSKRSPDCKTKQENCQDTLVELNNINSYLYFCCDAHKIRVICGNQVSTEVLSNAGVMTLGSDCTINSETFTIHSQRQFMDTIHAQVEEVTMEIPPINRIINLSVPVFKQEPKNETVFEQSSLLRNLGKQIDQMKAATAEGIISDRATYHDVHQYVAIYMLAAVAAIAGAIYAYHRLRKHCRSQQKPVAPPAPNPAPRRRSTASIVDNAVSDVTDDSSAMHLSSARTLNKATSPIARCDLIV